MAVRLLIVEHTRLYDQKTNILQPSASAGTLHHIRSIFDIRTRLTMGIRVYEELLGMLMLRLLMSVRGGARMKLGREVAGRLPSTPSKNFQT